MLGGSTIFDITEGPYTVLDKTCLDDLGRSTDHGFNSHKRVIYPAPLNGERLDGPGFTRRFTNWHPPDQRVLPAHLVVAGVPSVGVSATTALARTNPGRAVVSLPVFVGELRDLPHAIKSAGDFIRSRRGRGLKGISGQYLGYQFGWKPLFDDLRKMLQFQDHVDKRSRELARLYAKGGLKRRVELGTWSSHAETNVTLDSTMGSSEFVTARKSTDTSVRRWATVRWRPTKTHQVITDLLLRRLARKAVFGISIQAEDAWNLMPWTWLADWFSNCGDFLEAYNNRIPAACSVVNVMTHTKTQSVYRRTDSTSWVKGGDSRSEVETKNRSLSFGTIEADFQFLSGRQLSILGALAITRTKGFRS